jgi:MFS family permease
MHAKTRDEIIMESMQNMQGKPLLKAGTVYRWLGYSTGASLIVVGAGAAIGGLIGAIFRSTYAMLATWIGIGVATVAIVALFSLMLIKNLHDAGKQPGMAPLTRYSWYLFACMLTAVPVVIVFMVSIFAPSPDYYYYNEALQDLIYRTRFMGAYLPVIAVALIGTPLACLELNKLKPLFPPASNSWQLPAGLDGIRRAGIGLKIAFVGAFLAVYQFIFSMMMFSGDDLYQYYWYMPLFIVFMVSFFAMIPFLICGFVAATQGFFRLGRGFIEIHRQVTGEPAPGTQSRFSWQSRASWQEQPVSQQFSSRAPRPTTQAPAHAPPVTANSVSIFCALCGTPLILGMNVEGDVLCPHCNGVFHFAPSNQNQ